MSSDLFGAQGPGDRLYADAVCAQCGTVNPEGTLICKTCGNNLRDQRTIRLAADAELTARTAPVEKRRVVLGLLTLLGILLVLWMSFNVDSLANWLVNSQQASVDVEGALWAGKDGAVFEQLLAALDEVELSGAESRAILASPTMSETMEGLYVLGVTSPLGSRPVGMANAFREGETLYFVARVEDTVEVRGKARQQSNTWAASWDGAGAHRGEAFFSVAGIAVPKPEGYLECFGRAEISEEGYEFIACKVPATAPPAESGEGQ